MKTEDFKYHRETKEILLKVAKTYNLAKLKDVISTDDSLLYSKDIYICLHNILQASLSEGDVLENLKLAKNIYQTPIFVINAQKGTYQIKNKPDFELAITHLNKFPNCFKLNPYSIVNTFLALIVAHITGYNLEDLYKNGVEHIESFIDNSLKNNPQWDKKNLISKNPILIIPIGAAGTGKSTFYRELPNVINISCDNIRYLLFKEFGPCFSPWESTLSWWVVNQLTDSYLSKGYSVFYNGVNTDIEYRSPITMENPDALYAGMPYRTKLVYFEPPVKLSEAELKELKEINLWATSIEKIDLTSHSANVVKIIDLIKNNHARTLSRMKEIAEGKKSQDPYDVLYPVPAPIIKLFVEQSFEMPRGENVVVIPRREIPDEKERQQFYRYYALKVLND